MSSPVTFELDELPVPLVFATHRIIREANSAFAQLFGYDVEELRNQSFKILYPEVTDFVMVGELWRKNFAGGKIYLDERIMRKRDGTQFWCRVRGKSLDEHNPFARAVYCFDVMPRPVSRPRMELTPRQRQIVTLISQGKTNAQIAKELTLSVRSVETHRYRLLKKLGLKNSPALVSWFAEEGQSDQP